MHRLLPVGDPSVARMVLGEGLRDRQADAHSYRKPRDSIGFPRGRSRHRAVGGRDIHIASGDLGPQVTCESNSDKAEESPHTVEDWCVPCQLSS
jgi:hypothetical protein